MHDQALTAWKVKIFLLKSKSFSLSVFVWLFGPRWEIFPCAFLLCCWFYFSHLRTVVEGNKTRLHSENSSSSSAFLLFLLSGGILLLSLFRLHILNTGGLFCCCFIFAEFFFYCCSVVFSFYIFSPTQQKNDELKKSSRFFPQL